MHWIELIALKMIQKKKVGEHENIAIEIIENKTQKKPKKSKQNQ